MANPKHGTTTPDVVLELTLDRKYRFGEVMNVDGAGEVYFTVDGETDPTVGGDGCFVLPAAMGRMPVEFEHGDTPVIKLISALAVKVSVRGT